MLTYCRVGEKQRAVDCYLPYVATTQPVIRWIRIAYSEFLIWTPTHVRLSDTIRLEIQTFL